MFYGILARGARDAPFWRFQTRPLSGFVFGAGGGLVVENFGYPSRDLLHFDDGLAKDRFAHTSGWGIF